MFPTDDQTVEALGECDGGGCCVDRFLEDGRGKGDGGFAEVVEDDGAAGLVVEGVGPVAVCECAVVGGVEVVYWEEDGVVLDGGWVVGGGLVG